MVEMLPQPVEPLSGVAVGLQAMSLDVPSTPGHPNKHPFSGILTRIDEPSDAPPHGSGNRLVVLTKAAAEEALPTLLGMAVDSMPSLDGHQEARKIGIITGATIEGNAIAIEGFFYAKDFPDEVRKIVKQKKMLGFSFELNPTDFEITPENYFQVNSAVFTGAALLYKNKAAYHSTSLAAGAQQTEIAVTKEELETLFAPMKAQMEALAASVAKIEAGNINANAETIGRVEPHAKGVESCAASMEGAGIGLAPTAGHVAVLRRMAASMRAEAAMGKMPHIYRDHDYNMGAAAVVVEKPEDSATTKALADLKASLEAISTKFADLKAGARQEATAPERKTLTPSLTALLDRHGIKAGADGEIDVSAVSAALKKQGMEPERRIAVIRDIERAALGLEA